jgi:AI-2E family transporter
VITLGMLVIGPPHVGTLALLSFVSLFIPILGAWVSGVVIVLVTLAAVGTGGAVAMAVVILVAQQLDSMFVTPLVYQQTMNLHPIVTLTPSSRRRARCSAGRLSPAAEGSLRPTPTPTMTRPPLSRSIVASSLASCGALRAARTITAMPRLIVSVTAAADVRRCSPSSSATREVALPATLSSDHSPAKPSSSARMA